MIGIDSCYTGTCEDCVDCKAYFRKGVWDKGSRGVGVVRHWVSLNSFCKHTRCPKSLRNRLKAFAYVLMSAKELPLWERKPLLLGRYYAIYPSEILEEALAMVLLLGEDARTW